MARPQVTSKNRTNSAAGWVLGYGLLLFALWLDPLEVLREGFHDEGGSTALYFSFTAGLLALSVLGHAFFATPRVVVTEEAVRFMNVLTEVVIPRRVLEVDPLQHGYPWVGDGQRRYRAWGAEGQAAQLHELVGTGTGTGTAEVRPRRLQPSLVLLLAIWVLYLVAGVLMSFG